jgi:hypothetical protein
MSLFIMWLAAVSTEPIAGLVAIVLSMLVAVTTFVMAAVNKTINWKWLALPWAVITAIVAVICAVVNNDRAIFYAIMGVFVLLACSFYCWDIRRLIAGKNKTTGAPLFTKD